MKRICFALLTFVVTMSVMASPIDRRQARQVAEKFLQTRGSAISGEAARAIGGKQSVSGHPLYVFNAANDRGFVIVAGDDSVESIIGYTTHGSFDDGDLPENFRSWLEQTAAEIASIKDSPAQARDASVPMATARPIAIHAAIEPLIITTWNQGNTDNVYNAHLPLVDGNLPCTGCTATAGAQLMYYYHNDLPYMTLSVPGYTLTDKDGNDASHGAKTSEDLPAIHFQWDKMKTSYSKDDPDIDAVNAVADLMLYCGYAAHMNYGLSDKHGGSSASTSTLADGMSKFFDFNPRTWRSVTRAYYSISEWDELIYNELANGRPIIYSGSYKGGHAFICDGYDGAGMYHFNWGWGGNYNGYFKLQATNPYGEQNTAKMGYIDSNYCIIGLQPNAWPSFTYADSDDTWETVSVDGIVTKIYTYTIEGTTLTIQFHNNTEEDRDFGFAMGELINDYSFSIVDDGYESQENKTLKSGYLRKLKFNVADYNLSEGVHYLVPLNKLKGETEWKRCVPTDIYFEVNVAGGTYSIIPHPIENLQINQFDLASGGTPGKSQGINLSITNNGDNIEAKLYVYVGTADDNGEHVGGKTARIASGSTKDYNIHISKLDAGNHVLRLLNKDKVVLAEKEITIALDLQTTKIEVAEPRLASCDIKVIATVENHAGDYAVPLYLLAGRNGSKDFHYAAGSAIERGGSEDVTFYFKPDATGTWTIYIATDEEGNNIIGETTVDVAEAPTGEVRLELAGSRVKCEGNNATYTMSVKNISNTVSMREIRTWLYTVINGEKQRIAYQASPKVVIEPGETKDISVTYEGLEVGKSYSVTLNYTKQFGSWDGAWLGSFEFTFNTSEDGDLPGDIDGDGFVTSSDIIAIMYIIAAGGTDMRADLNSDGIINIADVIAAINKTY